MIRGRYWLFGALPVVFFAGAALGDCPILDRIASKVVAKYQSASGVNYAALPTGCVSPNVGAQTYYLRANTWFRPACGANGA